MKYQTNEIIHYIIGLGSGIVFKFYFELPEDATGLSQFYIFIVASLLIGMVYSIFVRSVNNVNARLSFCTFLAMAITILVIELVLGSFTLLGLAFSSMGIGSIMEMLFSQLKKSKNRSGS
jgi:hypothetical protein